MEFRLINNELLFSLRDDFAFCLSIDIRKGTNQIFDVGFCSGIIQATGGEANFIKFLLSN